MKQNQNKEIVGKYLSLTETEQLTEFLASFQFNRGSSAGQLRQQEVQEVKYFQGLKGLSFLS